MGRISEATDSAADRQPASPKNRCVHVLFEEQARLHPERVAVVLEKAHLTYAELDRRADHLAQHLAAMGVRQETPVGVFMERSLEMIVGLLAIMKAGGCYVPLDPGHPPERLALVLSESGVPILLTQRALVGKLPPHGAQTLFPDDLDFLESPANFPPRECSPEALAYIMFTSGSTGVPKGVAIPHRGIVRLVTSTDYADFGSDETFLQLAPISFDASTFELWGALLNGGKLVLMPPGPPSLEEIGTAIRKHGVTTLWLTAGLFNVMIDERIDDLRPLRQLLTGGDVLSVPHVRKALRELPATRLINGYGPTECTTFACCHTISRDELLDESVPIGRPISNTHVYILDAHRHPVPPGVTGELYIGGPGLARGYFNAPQLTAERFVANPFVNGGRLYKTGDLARYLPDGNIVFVGRNDDQVKIRGFRVEPGEVEAALKGLTEVSDAAIVVREDASGEKRLVACLVAKGGTHPTERDLRSLLAQKLPDYMVPSAFCLLDALPLTPNGKLDRKASPALETSGGASPTGAGSPINLLELELIRIWQRLFQRQKIDRCDNFFALGGHSLLAIRMGAEIENLLGCKLPIAALFQSPTVEALARRLSDENWAPPWRALVPLKPQGSKPPIFFVHGAHGDVYCFLELAKLLPADQPCYGIQAVGLDGKSERHITVEGMAAHYVKEITSFQPEGPLYLTGFSMGGVIAFEIAQQLHRLGRRVAFLALLDSGPVGAIPWFFYALSRSSYIGNRCLYHLRRWCGGVPHHEWLSYLRGRWASLRHYVDQNRSKPPIVTTPPVKGIHPPEVPPGFEDYYHAIAASYQPSKYPGSADLFVSEDFYLAWKLYWRYLVRGGVSIHRFPGGHMDPILNPDSRLALVKSLTSALQCAQEKEQARQDREGISEASLVAAGSLASS